MSENTSPEQLAERVLAACLTGANWQPAEIDALADADSDALFHILAEGLADRFDPKLDDAYADIFSHAIARVDHRFTASELRTRYRALRPIRPFEPSIEPKRIVLLSRVTLGADIAVTSIFAQALQARFPNAELLFAGSRKSAELLGLPLLPIDYARSGGLRARLRSVEALLALGDDTLIVDPDSRMTQLGVYPIAPEQRYCFFNSRAVDTPGSLTDLARDWCAQVFGVHVPRPRIQVGDAPFEFARPAIAVSLGVGGNQAKRIRRMFERQLLRELSSRAATVILDKGAGEEEAACAESAAAGLDNVKFWSGSFAGFAALIARSDLYVGYDSAGQHAAAALGIPLLSIFAGAVNDRFFERWRPAGRVVRVDGGSPESAFLRVRSALSGSAATGPRTQTDGRAISYM